MLFISERLLNLREHLDLACISSGEQVKNVTPKDSTYLAFQSFEAYLMKVIKETCCAN